MNKVIHFNMLVDINKILKEKKIEYSLHSIGGCVSCGVELIQEGKECPVEDIMVVINEYLKVKFMFVESDPYNPYILVVK